MLLGFQDHEIEKVLATEREDIERSNAGIHRYNFNCHIAQMRRDTYFKACRLLDEVNRILVSELKRRVKNQS